MSAGESLSSCPRIWKTWRRFPNSYATAPTRINLSPALLVSPSASLAGRAPSFGDVFALRVRLRPPEMGIVVVIGAFCRYWEGGFVLGGRKCCSGERDCLVICLEVVGAGVGCLLCRGWLGKSTPGFCYRLCWGVAGRRILPRAPKSVKMLSHFYGFNALRITDF